MWWLKRGMHANEKDLLTLSPLWTRETAVLLPKLSAGIIRLFQQTTLKNKQTVLDKHYLQKRKYTIIWESTCDVTSKLDSGVSSSDNDDRGSAFAERKQQQNVRTVRGIIIQNANGRLGKMSINVERKIGTFGRITQIMHQLRSLWWNSVSPCQHLIQTLPQPLCVFGPASFQKSNQLYFGDWSVRLHQVWGMASRSPGTRSGILRLRRILGWCPHFRYKYFNPKTKTHFRAAIKRISLISHPL